MWGYFEVDIRLRMVMHYLFSIIAASNGRLQVSYVIASPRDVEPTFIRVVGHLGRPLGPPSYSVCRHLHLEIMVLGGEAFAIATFEIMESCLDLPLMVTIYKHCSSFEYIACIGGQILLYFIVSAGG